MPPWNTQVNHGFTEDSVAGSGVKDLIVTQEIMQNSGGCVLSRGRKKEPEGPGDTGAIRLVPGRNGDNRVVITEAGDVINSLYSFIYFIARAAWDNLDVQGI